MTDSPKRLKIDFEELQLAFQGSFSGDSENYLDTETGEVIPLHDEFEDAEEVRARDR